MDKPEIETCCPASPAEWRQWLKENHRSKQSVWLVIYKKSAGVPTLSHSEAVDEALCFGWIDSIKKSLDPEKAIQFFSKRKPTGTWSKINKEKVERLIANKKMTKAGLDIIEAAKQNGSWTILDDVEQLTIPADLEKAFNTQKGSMDYFMGLSRSAKKMMLQWLVMAKRPETRQKRIDEIAENASQQLKPKQFR